MAFGEGFKKKFKGAAKRIKSAFARDREAAPANAAKQEKRKRQRMDEADARQDAIDDNTDDDGSGDTGGGAMHSGRASASVATSDGEAPHSHDSRDDAPEDATESQAKNYARPPGMSDAEWERYRVDLARRIEARHRANCSQRDHERKQREEAERLRKEQEEVDRILEEAKAAAEALRRRNRVAASATPSAPGTNGGAGSNGGERAIDLYDKDDGNEVENDCGLGY